jgi:putative restriction endonuclease
MTKAVFTVKAGSGYDDRPEEYYHFPRTYLNQVRNAVGDYIIYYEPRRTSGGNSVTGQQAYFATARVTEVIADDKKENHYYALISDYLDFDKPVPFMDGGSYYEGGLQKEDGSTNKGAFGRAVRLISDTEFDLILRMGFAEELGKNKTEQLQPSGFEEPEIDFVRPIIEMTVSRPFRDRAFTAAVRSAYENRCAVTGLCLINGGGRPEVQAAHIRPVSEKGPDTVRNGLALSGTFHWLFDRGLISISDDYRILIAENKLPEQARRILNSNGKVILPKDLNSRPNPHYLKFHRDLVFKG